MPTYFYVFVRTDIPLADQICQVAHASADAALKFNYQPGMFLVLLAIPDQKSLIDVESYLNNLGLKSLIVYEPDDNLGFTALASQPISGHERQVFRKFKCWREK